MADIPAAEEAIRHAQVDLEMALAALADTPPDADVIYTARTDTRPEPKPDPLPLGAAPFTFRDPIFGTTIIRVTDERTAGGTSIRSASNAHVAVWNADSSRFYGMKASGGAQFFRFDGARRRTSVDPVDVDRAAGWKGPKGLDPIDVKSYVEPSFSFDDPNLVICGGGENHRCVYSVDLRDATPTLLCNLDLAYDWLAARGDTYLNALVTAHGAWVVAFGGAGQDLHECVHYQRADGTWLGHSFLEWEPQGASQWEVHIHSVALDQSGRYVLVYTTAPDIQQGKPKVIVWDTQRDSTPNDPAAFTPLDQNAHHVSGHDTQGYGISVNQDTSAGQYDGLQWTKRTLANPTVGANVLPQTLQPPQVYVEDHSNWRNGRADNQPPYFSFTWRHDTSPTPWRAWDDEIIGVKPDGSAVYRFLHHQAIGGDQEFWDQALGHLAPNGRRGSFSSNWGKRLLEQRQDLFVFLPA